MNKIREKPDVCEYGCGKEAKFLMSSDKWCRVEKYHKEAEVNE